MKIGIFDPYLDTLGGGEKYMLTLAECLSKNHTVSIFWDTPEDVKQNVSRFGLDFTRVLTVKNIFSPRVSTRERLIASRRFDAIIFLSDGSIPFVLSRKLFLHFQFPIEWVKVSASARLKMKRATGVFCNSHFTASYIDRTFGIKSRILYPPVDTARANTQTEKERMILHVGRFAGSEVEGDDYKKQQKMVTLFKTMVDQGLKGWEFVVAASVKKKEEERFAKMQDSAKGYPVRFVTNSTNARLWDYYNKAAIYWHASGLGEDLVKHPERAEHFGISTVEAMSAGAVPVVIAAGGQSEIVTDNTNGLLWSDTAECISKTMQLIEDESLRKRLSKGAIERAKDFTKERFCEEAQKMVK